MDICGPSIPKVMGLEGEQVHQSGSGWSLVVSMTAHQKLNFWWHACEANSDLQCVVRSTFVISLQQFNKMLIVLSTVFGGEHWSDVSRVLAKLP